MLVLLLWAAPSSAFDWRPLLQPRADDLLKREVLTEEKVVRLQPGESVVVEPDRLAYVTLQFRPIAATSQLRVERLFDGGTVRAGLALEPLQLREGELLLHTGIARNALRISLDEDASEAVRLSAAQLDAIEPWLYWEWWQQKLHDWIDAGAPDEPPEGLPIPAQGSVLQEARTAGMLMEVTRGLTSDPDLHRAVRHLAYAFVLRGVQRFRRPQRRFYRRRPLHSSLEENPALTTVDTGSFRSRAWRLGAGVPRAVTVEGPAVVRLGLRAIKTPGAPDALTRYSLATSVDGQLVRSEDFSSRAATRRQAEDDDAERARRARDESDFVRSEDGDVVGWRRRTQLWIPPGRHEVTLVSTGADVLVDGTLYRPRTHLEDAVRRREDVAHHVARCEALLEGDESIAARLLRMELFAFLYRADEAATWHRLASSQADVPRAVSAWLDWRAVSWLELDGAELDRIAAATKTDTPLDDALRWALLERALEAERHGLAYEVATDLTARPTESAHHLKLQASALSYGTGTRTARWEGLLSLWNALLRRPHDERLREAFLETWWHRTYWDGLDVPRGDALLQPLGEEGEYVTTESLAPRRGVLYALPPDGQEVWAPTAPDRADRLHRLRLAAFSEQIPAVHDVSIDGERHRVVRRRGLEFFDFAVRAGTRHTVRSEDRHVYATSPPADAVEVPAHRAFVTRDVHHLEEDERAGWDLPMPRADRFARLNLRVSPSTMPTTVEIDDGVGAIRHVRLERTRSTRTLPGGSTPPTAERDEPRWLRIEFQIPAGAQRVDVRARGGVASAALDVRAPRSPPDREPLEVRVELPPDDTRLGRIQEISARLAIADDLALRLERLELLMSLDQDRLARVDAEHILAAEEVPVGIRRRTERLWEALAVRLSSRWLEIGDEWLEGRRSVPLDPVLIESECPAELLRRQPTSCPDVARYLTAADADGLEAARTWRALWKRGARDDWLFAAEFARAVIDVVESDPGAAPPGLAAEAYGAMREAMAAFPTRRNRARLYATMRWTRWESVPTVSPGSFLARFEPPLDPVNASEVRLPTMVDPAADAVEFAMLGQAKWAPEELYPLYGFHRRVMRFHVYWDGILEVASTCVDLRPDLQPADQTTGCEITSALQLDDGTPLQADSDGSTAPGRQSRTRWVVRAGQDVKLSLHRPDGLIGRAFRVRPILHRSGRDSWVPPRRLRRRLDTVPPQQHASLEIQGPVVVRLDLRGIMPGAASSVTIRLDDRDVETVSLPSEREPEALLEGQPLTRSVRRILWLDEARTYRLSLEGGDGFAAARVSLRTDDYEALLRPEGRGVLEPDDDETDVGPIETPGRGDLAIDVPRTNLLFDEGTGASGIAEVDFTDRDRTLLDDDQLVRHRVAFLRLRGGGYFHFDDVWLDARLGSRLVAGPPVGEASLDAYWRAPWNLRLEAKGDLFGQRVASTTALAARGEVRLLRPVTLAPDWLLLPSVEATTRAQPASRFDDRIDAVVFNDYAADHPMTYDAEVAIWYRPFLNAMLRSELRARQNADLSVDQLNVSFEGRALFESTEAEIGYGARWLLSDADRSQTYLFHDIDLSGALAYWVAQHHQLTLNAWTRLTFAPGTSAPFRPRMGLGLTYWFSRRGLRDRPSSELIYDDLLEPRYFVR
jgi:hypothetical protein